MVIAVIATEYEPTIIGGLGIVATRLSEALAARGHQVIVLTRGSSRHIEEIRKRHLRVFRYPRESQYFSKRTQTFYADPILKHLKKMNIHPDLIHLHSVQGDQLAEAMARYYGISTMYTCHSLLAQETIQSSFARRMEQRQCHIIERSDAIVSPSRWQALLLTSQYPSAAGKTFVIPNGTRVTRNPRIWNDRSMHHILFVGRLIRSKCALETITAISTLRKVDRNVRLDLIGQGGRDYTALLRKETARLHLTPYVQFLGSLSHKDVLKRMQRTGIVVVPSRNESFGLVALEAMGTGTPLVATRAGGLSDFVSNDTASIITNVTAQDIAKAIQHVWNHPDKTLKRRYLGYSLAKQYSWEEIAQSYEKVGTGKGDLFKPQIESEGHVE